MVSRSDHDPRSEAERARADLKANSELGLAPPESPITAQPSVPPATFGVTNDKARLRSGTDQGLEAGGAIGPGYGATGSESLVEDQQVTAGSDRNLHKSS